LKRIVLDASVAAKWLLPPPHEPLRDEALQIARGYNEGQYEIFIPDVFWAEIANFLWKAARSSRCTPAEARTTLEIIFDYSFQSTSSISLLPGAFDIATLYDRAVYDCLYVALAQKIGGELITADEKLANALAAHYPVKLLGAI
jgi:predicted nucleic acid-binding protein